MSLYEILLLSLALAADAFAVGICVGVNHHRPRQIFRLSFHFGLFQALMALAGMLGGRLLLELIQVWDHWLAFGLLAFIGGRMLLGDGSGETKAAKRDPTRGGSLVGLSLAVSMDALAAGVGIAVAFDLALKQLRAVVLDRTGRRVDMRVASRLFEHALGVAHQLV